MVPISGNSREILDRYVINLLIKKRENIWINVTGDCMDPWILYGDKVYVTPKDNYSVGDMVVCYSNGRLLAHRIVHICNEQIITKGDNTYIMDGIITSSDIVGIIVAKKNDAGDECLISNEKSMIVRVGAYFSYLNGYWMNEHLRTSVLWQKKILLFIHNVLKKIAIYLFKYAYKIEMKPQQDQWRVS